MPQIEASEVLVRVVAAGVQLTDAAVRGGWVPPGATIEFPLVPGNEFAGAIEAVGEDVREFAIGDEVAGFRVLGCYAELVVVPATQIVRKPKGVDWLTAGALSASGQTAHTALERLNARSGKTLLVHGAAGGVRTPLLFGGSLFLVGLLLCVMAPNMTVFIAGRLLQGIGGGIDSVVI